MIRMSEEQALAYQWKIISNWEKPSEVWSLRYAPGVLAAMATCTGIFVNNHYRNKLKLECPTCGVRLESGLRFRNRVWCGIYPTNVGPFAACMFATRHFTYRLPSITEKPLEVFQLIKKFTKPIMPVLGSILIGQSLVTIYLTYKEQEQNLKVLMKMKKFEQQVEQELGM
ncbi:hypothetical protein DOY81_011202 [Sarcophaga bullata]|nr:hypothetical protein DOY81_011202 [Sarcophaga bullata]